MALLWLSLRVRWRRAWARSLAVVLIVGAVGGFVMAAAASARQVEGTYQVLIDEIDAPDLVVIPRCERQDPSGGCLAPAEQVDGDIVVERLNGLAPVRQARLVESVLPYFIDAGGRPLLATADDEFGCFDDDRSVSVLALSSGGPNDQPMPFRLDGELPAPGSSEVVFALATAERVGLGIGDEVRLAGWCNSEGKPAELAEPIDLTVTGLTVGPLDIEPPGTGLSIEPAYVDPFVVERMVSEGAEPLTNAVVWLDRSASADEVGRALEPYDAMIDFAERATVFDEALAKDARLLWLLAGVGAVGAVLLLAPIVGRNVRDTAGDVAIAAALGSSRRQIALQAVAHVGVIAAFGAVLAAILAPVISVFMPRGFAESIAPDRALWLDGLVTIVGVLLLISVVVAMGTLPAWNIDRSRHTTAPRGPNHRATAIGASRLRPAAQSGMLTALGTPAGPRQPSPWPSVVSLAIAGVTCAAALTYLAGLDHLEHTPSLVGWNWDAAVAFEADAAAAIPSILAEIDEIDGIQQVTGGTMYPPVFLGTPDSDISVWPWSFGTGPDAITPTMLSGRAPDGPDEVAISSAFADMTGLATGDRVTLLRPTFVSRLADEYEHWVIDAGWGGGAVDEPAEQPIAATFDITGLAVLPLQRTEDIPQVTFTLGGLAALIEPSEDEIATAAAWLPDDLPEVVQTEADWFLSNIDIDDRSVYLRFSSDLRSTAEALLHIEGVSEVVAPTADEVLTIGIGLNLSRNHRVPAALVYVVAVAAAALLAYLLITAVRARRVELAIMRALGLSSAGVRWSIAAQATATALIPLIVGLPLGVAAGRHVWLTDARGLDVVPEAVTPWWALAVVASAAVLIANLAVLAPGWAASRRSPDTDLRAG